MSDASPLRIQILARDNAAGLSRDLALLDEALRQLGAEPTPKGLPHRGRFATWLTRRRHAAGAPSFDLNLMLERVRPEFARAARRNVLIPNPEYFRAEDRAALAGIDEVWTKTHHAGRLFAALGARTRHIGFTSPDRWLPEIPRERAFFHGPGRSGNKGTEALLALWAQHPQWPTLTVAWRRKRVELAAPPANVRLIREHLDDAAYRRLQNSHRFHLCPSQTEGFGHYLVEAMSCAAVVVTLNAEPMNELVSAERGVLVPASPVGQQDLATLYGFEPEDMRQAVERCLGMDEARAERIGKAARNWFAMNQSTFQRRLRDALDSVPAGKLG